jgi:hypothetical protein
MSCALGVFETVAKFSFSETDSEMMEMREKNLAEFLSCVESIIPGSLKYYEVKIHIKTQN